MKRRGWDSNPRALADKRFSRPPRYDHFDTPARERVMGIEPTYPAWKAGVLPLNYTRIFNCSQVGVTGFEPATSWSQTRRSSQAEPHPDMLFCRFVFVASPKRLRYNITLFYTCQHFFTFFLNYEMSSINCKFFSKIFSAYFTTNMHFHIHHICFCPTTPNPPVTAGFFL